MFFLPARVEAAEWVASYNKDLFTLYCESSLPAGQSYPFTNSYYGFTFSTPNSAESNDGSGYNFGGTSTYKDTVYYRCRSTLSGDITYEGAFILDLKETITLPDNYLASMCTVSNIRVYGFDDAARVSVIDIPYLAGQSVTTRVAVYLDRFYTYDVADFVVAVDYEWVVGWSPSVLNPEYKIAVLTPSATCSSMNIRYSVGEVLGSETEGIISNQESIAESQMQQQESIAESQAQQSEEQHEETKGLLGNIIDGILGIPGKILDVLVSVFVPDAEYFSNLFDEMNTFFSDRFGLLYYPFDVVIDFAGLFLSPSSTGGSVPFPEISWEGTTIISAQQVSILQDESFLVLQERLYFVGNVIMSGALIGLAHKKINEVMKS